LPELTMRIDLSAPVTMDTMKSTVTAFWSWWTGELRGLLPPIAAGFLDRLVQQYAVTMQGDVWRLQRIGADDASLSIDVRDDAVLVREQIERMEPSARMARIAVMLEPDDVLFRTVRLPASAAAHLRSVVELQLERLSPFPADAVRFDCKTLEEVDGDIEVEVGIVPRATLDGYQARLGAYGLQAAAFHSGGMTFRPSHMVWRRQQAIQAALCVAATVLWIGVFALAPILREHEFDTLADDVARLRGPAQQALAERDEVARLAVPANAVSQALAKPDLLDVLRALTRAVPDDTHLTDLTLDRDKAAFTAIGPDPRGVAIALEHAGGFLKPHIVLSGSTADGAFAVDAPITADAGEDGR
jgi:general secretion pathway protein L